MSKLYECPLCKDLNTVEEWDNITKKECISREQRRKYIPLNNPIKEHLYKDTSYKCPSCLKFIRRLEIKESKIKDEEVVK